MAPITKHASRNTECGSRAFTLVEALVSLAIFGVGIAALMPMVVANVRANDNAGVRTRAVAVCQDKVEEFRALTYQEILNLYGTTPNGSDTAGEFTREWWIEDAPGPSVDQADLKRVRVETRWNLPGRPPGSVVLMTSRARY